MFKLLLFAILSYLGYRLIIKPMLFPPEKDKPEILDDPEKRAEGSRFSKEEGDFIDYEELDK